MRNAFLICRVGFFYLLIDDIAQIVASIKHWKLSKIRKLPSKNQFDHQRIYRQDLQHKVKTPARKNLFFIIINMKHFYTGDIHISKAAVHS